MTETRPSVYNRHKQCKKSSVFKLRLKVLNSSAERQLCDNEFQTERALTLKAIADYESAIRGTESNSFSADRSVLSGW